ncbi:Double-stranded RNA-binding protein Staufen like protein 2 [Trachymyrmex septentrionalis]|uniref:Double-stranded RNA-binding protein Staufen like protein 2 n=2 Tax=Trachymyrmex septentrionalis TaxID=34720 RepID=A0A195ERB9_9HYME|nr:PREDICTED: interferon-inducible double-stranded RNA-dependent protein kinase activator A-like isoform X2 [Trachymyrmex septentrionalis]XP_018354467.1 PREDICTED: interferon-inducible double-stranded RNA-dependent protein kinase activator A-like isoform X2 [Trachymyrmex septentrionalis]XP_018354468.1 PREDICTED: interferon-inducible double-stranded RNA-dependent protein kinase activator A-like isoform X2 [Trachymyrmex septentrionalis]XP_018354469.1 PREDICTED: interferon-inducible double-stranded
MAKSEINLLQELSVKRGFMPIYNFSENNINYKKEFICNVVCKELITHGTGSTKKEAKHNAARNMLSLLATNRKISSSVVTPQIVTSPIVTNVSQNPEKVFNTSSVSFPKEYNSNKQFTVEHNYIGMLQEFCQQRQISAKDIRYELIYDEGLPHMKTFTIKVSLGSLCERGTGQCKKFAKQEAAKKMLLHLNPNIIANKNVDTHIAVNDRETLENNIRELGTKISECVNKDTLSVEKLSENAKSLYLKCTKRTNIINQEINPLILKDFHMLFGNNYSNKITYCMIHKMQIILDKYPREDSCLMYEIRQDIEQVLKVKIQQITPYSKSQNYLICLRLLSNPCITQFGIGENRMVAECHAMYNLVRAILIFIN